MELPNPQPFDFLINEQLIRQPLHKFVASHRLSVENVINIEYIPAVSLSDESQSVELPAWIGSLDLKFSSFVTAGCFDGQLQFIDSLTLKVKGTFAAHEHPIRDVVGWENCNTKLIATASKDHSLKCWSIDESPSKMRCSQNASLIGHLSSVECVDTVSLDDKKLLVSGDWTGTVHGWDVAGLGSASGSNANSEGDSSRKKRRADCGAALAGQVTELRPSFTLKAHVKAVSGLQAAPDGKLYSCSWDQAVKEWDVERQDCVATFAGPKVATSLHYSEQSRLIATSHPDGKVRLWDSRQREEASVKGSFSGSRNWIAQVNDTRIY